MAPEQLMMSRRRALASGRVAARAGCSDDGRKVTAAAPAPAARVAPRKPRRVRSQVFVLIVGLLVDGELRRVDQPLAGPSRGGLEVLTALPRLARSVEAGAHLG